MERLKVLIEQFGRWSPLSDYVRRIEAYKTTDASICIENAKAILESIAKEICKERGQSFSDNDNTGKLLNLAFGSIGYDKTDIVRQVSGSIANVGQRLGNLRNQVGPTSHGKTMEELEKRNSRLDEIAIEFLLKSTELVSCLLIELFEVEFPRKSIPQSAAYEDNESYNDFLDESYGEFKIGANSYSASQILHSLNLEDYKSGLQDFVNEQDGND